MSKFLNVGTEAAATCNAARLSLQALVELSTRQGGRSISKIDDVLLKRLDRCRSPLLLRQAFVMSREESTQRNDCDSLSEIWATNIPSLLH